MNDVLGEGAAEFHGPVAYILHALQMPVPWIALAGAACAWYLYLKNPALPERLPHRRRHARTPSHDSQH